MPTVTRIATVDDERVADYSALGDPDLVRRRGLFVAEGRLVVERLIALDRYTIRSLLLSDAALAAMRPVLALVAPAVPAYACTVEAMARLTGLHIHRGCLALVERPASQSVDAVVDSARTVVILEGIANPDNVGGIFRNVAAFGADAVLLSPTCCDPLYRKAVRTSMAATLQVPFARVPDWPVGLRRLHGAGFVIAALTPRVPSQSIDDLSMPGPDVRVALMFGAEGDGLTESACALADLRVRIPLADGVDSLNVAVAAGIALSRLAAGRR